MAGQKKRQECFPIHEIGRIDGGRGFQTSGNVLRIGGNTFYDQKKLNSDENSGVQKVRNWNNCVIPRNSKRISQPSMHINENFPKNKSRLYD